MLRHRNIDGLCCVILALTVLFTGLFAGAAAMGGIAGRDAMGYEARLFDQTRVHTIDIVMDGWEAFIASAASEEYAACSLVIDGESYRNAAIRGKGNTSLSSVENYGNGRYSFKVEFDHYQAGSTYHGLDKLSLNNLIQDNTCMKDYFAYTLMARAGVAAPLCSFVQVNVNGEYWGLYLAVEGVEDAFLERNYGKDHGELYKPDSMSFGGGRGNGRAFSMEDINMQEDFPAGNRQQPFARPEGGAMPDRGGEPPQAGGDFPEQGRDFGGGMNSSADVKLQYTGDDPADYANIFDNAKTDVTAADQTRLIASLKALGGGDTSVVDTEAVIRYMAVHNFLCNDDSYTGTMVHNYYLYEENGVLSMIPWDYNLAYGTMTAAGAASAVNAKVDTLVTSGGSGDRPMADWITADEAHMAAYHEAYRAFVATAFDSGWFSAEFDRVLAMISPCVESDPTAFCTYEEFLQGAQTLKAFCLARAESVRRQLNGDGTPVDAAQINLAAMGTMGGDRGGFGGGDRTMRGAGRMSPDAAMPSFGGNQAPDAAMPAGPSGPGWVWLAGCAALLLAGLALAKAYPNKR